MNGSCDRVAVLCSLQLGSRQKEKVHVSVAPGTYAVTAARDGGEEETSHKVTLEPGQAVTITLSIT